MEERIVCAANQDSESGAVILGARHWDTFMHTIAKEQLDRKYEDQGFITNRGRYVSRKEAWRIAEAQGQIVRRVGGDTIDGGTLFSENLY